MNKRIIAKTTGWSLIFMTLVAIFSVGYAYQTVYSTEHFSSLKESLISNKVLYQYMLLGIGVILILDLLVSYTLYIYFEKDNKKIALISAIIRVIYTIIFGVATFYLINNLNNEIGNELVKQNFRKFEFTWNFGLLIFGLHIILIGILMKLHKGVPKTLWYLTLFAGVSYIVVHFLKLSIPQSEFVGTLEMILALPMAIGELGLAIWLIIKGGKLN